MSDSTKGYIRGGAWSKTEDQIVTAAVQKYGVTQWARVASLLNRRSALQCKARWFEFLDPALKTHKWSQQDDERLLELARRLPNMWRTIAPMMGRSSQACLDRYNFLLSGKTDVSVAVEESKPAKDQQDEDDSDALGTDEETEMLAEARARLANSLGKKAKRKLREKVEAQEKRLKMLEDHRKDHTTIKLARTKFGIDYNAAVPFEVEAKGPFDTAEDDAKDAAKLNQRQQAISKTKHVFGHERHVPSAPIKKRRPLQLPVLPRPEPEKPASKAEVKRVAALLAQLPAPVHTVDDRPPTPPNWGDTEDLRPSAIKHNLCRAIGVVDANNDVFYKEVAQIVATNKVNVSRDDREEVNALIDKELAKMGIMPALPPPSLEIHEPPMATDTHMYMRTPDLSTYHELKNLKAHAVRNPTDVDAEIRIFEASAKAEVAAATEEINKLVT